MALALALALWAIFLSTLAYAALSSSWAVQLAGGYAAYLAQIGAVETDKCDCQRAPPETVRHFLFECPQWANHRHLLQDVADSRWGDLSYYLGGRSTQRRSSGEPLDGPAKPRKPDLTVVRRTIDFAIATGRLT